jgi:hypothetical protein
MTSLREAWKRLIQRTQEPEPPDPKFGYRVFWVKEVRQWDEARRRSARAAVAKVVDGPDFVANPYGRRYTVPEVDDSPHAGLSLAALLEVLIAHEAPPGAGEDQWTNPK